VFEGLKLDLQAAQFLATWKTKVSVYVFSWTINEEYVSACMALPAELRSAVASRLVKNFKNGGYDFHVENFPWLRAKIDPEILRGLWNAHLNGREHFTPNIDLFKAILKRVTPEVAKSMATETIHAIERHAMEAYCSRLLGLARQVEGGGTTTVIEAWQSPIFSQPNIEPLVAHSLAYSGAMPSKRWLKTAGPIAEKTDFAALQHALEAALPEISKQPNQVNPEIAELLRGLLVFLHFYPTQESAQLLGRALRICSDKIPGQGARCQKGFGGAVWSLQVMGTFDALAALSLGKAKVKTQTMANQIESALAQAAGAQNITIAELEERIVPDFGLDSAGVAVVEMGEEWAELRLDALAKASLHWFSSTKELSAPSQAMKSSFADEIAYVKRQKKELEVTVSAQRRRLDRQMISHRRIPLDQWRENYLDHPVMRVLTNRLIWEFKEGENITLGFTDQIPSGREITVKLWHPIDSTEEQSQVWRDAVFSREIVQPFKQAFRELYVLTPAEERTNTYSNRFAAQIIRQHQAVTLMRDRGWKAALLGHFDGGWVWPSRTLSESNLEAQFFVEIAGEDGSDLGIATYISTDQVRFIHDGAPLELVRVPPVVFSEICRDVDLFVGVASIGNDPEWTDRGDQGFTEQAWHNSSFGDLNQMAVTRKLVLERLLPRLAIAAVSHIDGNFLIVKGTRHSYKIHLGSGNILIQPNNRYLCIVPSGKDSTSGIYLPFEGDRTLAVILSKATMLAADNKITDQTILRQL
jgi:hypothetical protein